LEAILDELAFQIRAKYRK